jgi:hypothetical protein
MFVIPSALRNLWDQSQGTVLLWFYRPASPGGTFNTLYNLYINSAGDNGFNMKMDFVFNSQYRHFTYRGSGKEDWTFGSIPAPWNTPQWACVLHSFNVAADNWRVYNDGVQVVDKAPDLLPEDGFIVMHNAGFAGWGQRGRYAKFAFFDAYMGLAEAQDLASLT